MIINLFTLTSEILYLYFLLKQTIIIKSKKQKILLICGICFSIMCSGAIFESTIFKYLLLTLFLYLSLKLVDRHTSISVLFTITFILLYKFIIEILTVFSLYEILDVNIIIIIFEILLLICSIIFSKIINKLNYKISLLWNGIKKFYIRYLFLIVYNIFILFTIYNLIKISEVV